MPSMKPTKAKTKKPLKAQSRRLNNDAMQKAIADRQKPQARRTSATDAARKKAISATRRAAETSGVKRAQRAQSAKLDAQKRNSKKTK